MELFKASNQWATRPDDERFRSLPEMFAAAKEYEAGQRTGAVDLAEFRAERTDDGLAIVKHGSGKPPVHLTYFGFGQLARRVSDVSGLERSIPVSYLRQLPPTLAAQVVNHHLGRLPKSDSLALVHRNDRWDLIALTSGQYERIPNSAILERLQGLPDGWNPPPAMDSAERPAGLYLSQKDMFVFLVNGGQTIEAAPGGRDTLGRGVFVENTIDGTGSFRVTMFYFQFVCGNHIVWGASGVRELVIRHIGRKARYFDSYMARQIRAVADASMVEDAQRIEAAKAKLIGPGRTETVDELFGKGLLSRTRAGEVYDLAEQYSDVHGDPRSVWGIVSGITRYSQRFPYGDQRTEMDRAGGKVLEMAWK